MSQWRAVPLGFCVNEVKRKNLGGGEQNLLSLSFGNIIRKDIGSAEGLLPESFDTYNVVEAGDTVLRLTDLQNDQRSLRVGLVRETGIITSAYVSLRPNVSIEPRFVNYYLKNMDFRKDFYALGAGVRQSLKFDELRRIAVPVPPLATQRAIADYLDTETARIDALIAKKQRMIELLQTRTESLVASTLDPVVDQWGEAPLKFVASIDVSNVDKKSYEGQLPVQLCNYTDVYYNRTIDGRINFMAATADPQQILRLTLKSGDVLITKDSETADDIAVPALVTADLPGVVLGYHLALLRPLSVRGDFLYWALRSRRCRDAFSLSASGVTRVGLRQDAVGRVPLPAAPPELQADVVDRLDRAARQSEVAINNLVDQVGLLRERRQALIAAVVTGELEVPGVAA